MRKLVNVLAVIGAITILTLFVYGVSLQRKSGGGSGYSSSGSAAPPLVETRSEPAGCGVSQITLDGVSNRAEGDYIYVLGRLVNNCTEPTGVEIKVTVYDNAGGIVSVDDQWPASVSNIPSGGEFPFETMVRRAPGAAKVDVRVISVKQWRQR